MTIVQSPNKPLIIALLATLISRVTSGPAQAVAGAVFYLAIAIWCYQEITDGANWFRRALGAGVFIYALVTLSRALR